MKKIFALVLALAMVLSVVACSGSTTDTTATTTETATETATAATETATEATEAAVEAEVTEDGIVGAANTVYDDSKYVSMTADELYQEALAEGGVLVIYSETSSAEKSIATFQEMYPGIEVECTKYKNYDISAKIPMEYTSDQQYCDVVVAGDSSGEKYNEWYPNGYVVAYVPDCMKTDLYTEFLAYGLPITMEADVWYYSKTMYPDGSPINNWWDIVEMDENGNSKYHLYTNDPSNETMMGILTNLVANSDVLAEAYKDKYGTDIEYTYNADELGVEAGNAGYEWIYRFLQTNHTIITDSDEVLATVDVSTEPALGIGTTLKYGDTIEAGENVGFCLGLQPWLGFTKEKYVYICTKTDNPAAARLYAIYALGGEDGTGAGYDFYVNRNGCYGVRYSHDNSTHSDIAYEELNVTSSNIDYVYQYGLDIQDFWTYYADKLN